MTEKSFVLCHNCQDMLEFDKQEEPTKFGWIIKGMFYYCPDCKDKV